MGIGLGGLGTVAGGIGGFMLGGPVGAAAGAGIGGALGGMFDPDTSAQDAARLQQEATDRATAENRRQFDIGQGNYRQAQENLAPWLQRGQRAGAEQEALMGLGGDQAGALRALQRSPGYQFRQTQGQRGMEAGLGARGGMGSGKALTAATQYGQDFASNEYGNRLSQLAGVSGSGQNAAMGQGGFLGQASQAGTQYAQNQGNLWTQNANAQGAAGMADANARRSSITGLANLGLSAYGAFGGGGNRVVTDYSIPGSYGGRV